MATDNTKTYQGSLNQIFTAAQKTIRDLNYKIDLMDKENGLLNFKTGMSWKSFAGQEMSLMLIDNGDDTVEVSITGRRNQSGVIIQVYDWGEGKSITKKIFANLDQKIDNNL